MVLALDVIAFYLGLVFAPRLLGSPARLAVTEFDGPRRRTVVVDASTTAAAIGAALATDPADDTVWVGTGNGELVRLSDGAWYELSLPEQRWVRGCCWHQGRLWVVDEQGVMNY